MGSHSLKAQVKETLENHRGRDRAIPGKVLAQRLGYKDDRAIRLIIRDLIKNGLPVASATEPPVGYFVANSFEESQEYLKVMRSRLVNDAYRRRDFKLAARNILNPNQLSLF